MRISLFCLLLIVASASAYAQRKDSVFLKTKSGTIYGTLTVPKGTKGKIPVVIFVPGSGPTDRNGNSGIMVNNSLLVLSDSLATHGIASLRFDKRGIGASKAAAPDESKLVFSDYVTDLMGWIRKLDKDKRFNRLYVAGHSEGSLVGMLAVKNTPVDGFISIAGAGKPADELIMDQLRAMPQIPKTVLDSTNDYFHRLKQGERIEQVPPGFYQSLFRASVQPYLISWIHFNPSKELAEVKVPTLIIQGNTDLQLDTNQARLLANAKPDAQLIIIPDMNHIFRDVPGSDRGLNIATYHDPALPLKSELVQAMVRFITAQSRRH